MFVCRRAFQKKILKTFLAKTGWYFTKLFLNSKINYISKSFKKEIKLLWQKSYRNKKSYMVFFSIHTIIFAYISFNLTTIDLSTFYLTIYYNYTFSEIFGPLWNTLSSYNYQYIISIFCNQLFNKLYYVVTRLFKVRIILITAPFSVGFDRVYKKKYIK